MGKNETGIGELSKICEMRKSKRHRIKHYLVKKTGAAILNHPAVSA